MMLCLLIGCKSIDNSHSNTITQQEKIKSISQLWYYTKSYYGYWQLLSDLNWDDLYATYLEKVMKSIKIL